MFKVSFSCCPFETFFSSITFGTDTETRRTERREKPVDTTPLQKYIRQEAVSTALFLALGLDAFFTLSKFGFFLRIGIAKFVVAIILRHTPTFRSLGLCYTTFKKF